MFSIKTLRYAFSGTQHCDGCLDIENEKDITVEDTSDMAPNSKIDLFWRYLFWGICSATAIYTSKSLMVNHGFHYPLTIAFRIFITLFVTYISIVTIRGYLFVSNSHYEAVSGPSSSIHKGSFLLNISWTSIPAAVAAAASLPILLEGILHMTSLSALVMLFPLIYATESLVLLVCRSSTQNLREIPWDIFVVACACGLILYNENRLMVPGLVFGIIGITLIGLTRACLVLESEKINSSLSIEKANHYFYIMTLGFGTLFSGAMAYHFENVHSVWPLSRATIATMALNLATMMGATLSGTKIMVFSSMPFNGGSSYLSKASSQGKEMVASMASNLFLLLATILSSPHSYVNWIQITSYLVANIFLFKINQIQDSIISYFSYIIGLNYGTFKYKYQPSKYTASSFIAVPLISTSYFLALLSTATIDSLPRGLSTTYDHSFQPVSRFDIVVSMYDEPPSSVADMLGQIKSTTFLLQLNASNQEPRVIVYTKKSSANLASLQHITGADIVERLENRGREGGTYLSHIVNKWDSLAEQTLFVQAHAHNMRELIPRINEYLVSGTGMLSLGFTGVACNCDRCGDRWSWEDDERMVPSLFENIYGVPCTKGQPILLSYKGQFVASARRIRGVDKDIFVDLLERITGVESNGTENRGGTTGEQSPSNPFFGFTMERLWGLVMQCATNERIGSRCPSLLSGMGMGGEVEDCQCLDELR